MLPAELLKGIEYKLSGGPAEISFGRMTNDSRSVRSGDLFVAFRGYGADGYVFIGDALAKGAAAVVSEKDFNAPDDIVKILVEDIRKALPVMADNFYGHPSRRMKMVGITGTNGKTTITYLIESVLRAARKEPGVIGTINYRALGKVTPAVNTTPGPLELQSILAGMAQASVTHVVMEVSSHALDQGRVDSILYDAAVFTNITPEHLDYHKTVEDYFKAKAGIFERLKGGGVAILNTDDPRVASLKGATLKRTITYGLTGNPDIMARDIGLSLDGSRFCVVTPKGVFNVSSPLVGRYNVSNILAATAVCYDAGLDFETIKRGIETLKNVPGRLEAVECDRPFKVFVDFAHTEDALYNMLSMIREVSKAPVVTVFGCGGNRDKTKRPLMGKVACKLSDRVIITSDNPRFEEPDAIIGDILAGVKGCFLNYETEPDRRKAIGKALSIAGDGSIVVIAGKGHENYQIVKDKVLHFDDREVVKEKLGSGSARWK